MINIKDGIFLRVRKIISDSIGIEEENIKEESSIFGDLGIESIDILDINYRLEKEFNIRIDTQEFWNLRKFFKNEDYIKNNRLTEAGIKELVRRFNGTNIESIKEEIQLETILKALTVKSIINFISIKVN